MHPVEAEIATERPVHSPRCRVQNRPQLGLTSYDILRLRPYQNEDTIMLVCATPRRLLVAQLPSLIRIVSRPPVECRRAIPGRTRFVISSLLMGLSNHKQLQTRSNPPFLFSDSIGSSSIREKTSLRRVRSIVTVLGFASRWRFAMGTDSMSHDCGVCVF
jgi:hypothetical protein